MSRQSSQRVIELTFVIIKTWPGRSPRRRALQERLEREFGQDLAIWKGFDEKIFFKCFVRKFITSDSGDDAVLEGPDDEDEPELVDPKTTYSVRRSCASLRRLR